MTLHAADNSGNATAPSPPVGKLAEGLGEAVQLAPFVVNGKPLSISIDARTKADRRYAEDFAEEVVEVAYETMGDANGAGLVVVGRTGEPHPVTVYQQFLALAADGKLDPAVATKVETLQAMLADLKTQFQLHDEPPEPAKEQPAPDAKPGDEKYEEPPAVKLSFEMIMPAIPMPLEGIGARLYQLAWAEGFDDAKLKRRLQALTLADLEDKALAKYDWVFYLPPRDAFKPVMKTITDEAVRQQRMGLVKRAAIRSALFVGKPLIKKAVEGMRKSMLFLTVLRAESGYSKDDILALTVAYSRVLMPNFKIDKGTERERALAAIEAQKLANIEYAKDPFVQPERLARFDPADYAAFLGEYTSKPPAAFRFHYDGAAYTWSIGKQRPRVYYPAGARRFVDESGKQTLEFKVDEGGTVTGVEVRRVRHREIIPRKRTRSSQATTLRGLEVECCGGGVAAVAAGAGRAPFATRKF